MSDGCRFDGNAENVIKYTEQWMCDAKAASSLFDVGDRIFYLTDGGGTQRRIVLISGTNACSILMSITNHLNAAHARPILSSANSLFPLSPFHHRQLLIFVDPTTYLASVISSVYDVL